MSPSAPKHKPATQLSNFLAGMFGMAKDQFEAFGNLPELPPEITSLEAVKMPGVMAPSNQPEFWADAPWRLEPDLTEIPITFYIRDANVDSPGYSPWRLDSLRIEQRLMDNNWHKLGVFLPENLPNMDGQGLIRTNFWVFSTKIRLDELQEIQAGNTVHLRAVFEGGVFPYKKPAFIERHLEVFLSKHNLPQGRVKGDAGPRRWFYGDTHYHSGYTNDIKEFGVPLAETRDAGLSIGLDWLVVTDHSCDIVL